MKKIIKYFIFYSISVMLLCSCINLSGFNKKTFEKLETNRYVPLTSTGPYEIINLPNEGRKNVMKIDGSDVEWGIVLYSLLEYKDKPVKITLSVDVKRQGAMGDLNWQVNNHPDYPSVESHSNVMPDIWHTMNGSLSIIPTAEMPFLYLTNWFNNTESTIYYIDNFNVTIEDTVVLPPPSPNPDFTLTPLKSVYRDSFLIGTVINPVNMTNPYFDLLVHHFNAVTAENALKPIELAPAVKGGQYRWQIADNMVNAMLRNGIEVQGHALVWHAQTPAWMTAGTREEVIANLENHFTQVLNHFKGRVTSWDVVNEAIRDNLWNIGPATNWRTCVRSTANPWYTALGADYVELSFRLIRRIDPSAKLYYNDYGLDNRNKSQVVVNMVNDINNRYKAETGGRRNLIEGIGMQGHYGLHTNINDVRSSIERFISTGLEISITELDINTGHFIVGNKRDTIMSDETALAQAQIYESLFKLFLEYKDHIYRVTMWGLDDHNSWLSAGNPCLFDRDLNAKPAFFTVLNAANR